MILKYQPSSEVNARALDASACWGSGFRFLDSRFGFRDEGFGCRVPGLGIWDSEFEFRVSGFGFRDLGSGFQDSGFRMRNSVSGFEFRVSGFGIRDSGSGIRGHTVTVLILLGHLLLQPLRRNLLCHLFSGWDVGSRI